MTVPQGVPAGQGPDTPEDAQQDTVADELGMWDWGSMGNYDCGCCTCCGCSCDEDYDWIGEDDYLDDDEDEEVAE